MQAETLRVSAQRTQSVLNRVTTQSVGTIDRKLIAPTLRVGMPPEMLRVSAQRTQSVLSGVTTQSVGTIDTSKHVAAEAPPTGMSVAG